LPPKAPKAVANPETTLVSLSIRNYSMMNITSNQSRVHMLRIKDSRATITKILTTPSPWIMPILLGVFLVVIRNVLDLLLKKSWSKGIGTKLEIYKMKLHNTFKLYQRTKET
jgi:hypothetical protein